MEEDLVESDEALLHLAERPAGSLDRSSEAVARYGTQ